MIAAPCICLSRRIRPREEVGHYSLEQGCEQHWSRSRIMEQVDDRAAANNIKA